MRHKPIRFRRSLLRTSQNPATTTTAIDMKRSSAHLPYICSIYSCLRETGSKHQQQHNTQPKQDLESNKEPQCEVKRWCLRAAHFFVVLRHQLVASVCTHEPVQERHPCTTTAQAWQQHPPSGWYHRVEEDGTDSLNQYHKHAATNVKAQVDSL